MSVTRFIISSLAAAGFGSSDGMTGTSHAVFTPDGAGFDPKTAPRFFTQDHYFTLAGHRSHSSHSSHSSHRSGSSSGHYSHTSHRSGTGGYSYSAPAYTPPAPVYTPPARHRTVPSSTVFGSTSPPSETSAPPPDSLPALSGRTKRFEAIVRRVQIALLARGFYRGKVDGIVGPALRTALRSFQKVSGLSVTGTITPQTLDALMISSQ